MIRLLHKILEWSEVWALLIPLAFMIGRRYQVSYMKPIKLYVWLALIINSAIVMIYFFKKPWNFPDELQSNNFLYNMHSVVRLLCFSWFFILLKQPFLVFFKKMIPILFIAFLLVNFIVFEDFFDYYSFSGRLLSIEVCLLLLYCLQYYFYILKEDEHQGKHQPSFWIVTGLSIYVVINFPIFLFYKAMLKQFEKFAIGIWDVHNISFIVFCIFLAKGFHEANKLKASAIFNGDKK